MPEAKLLTATGSRHKPCTERLWPCPWPQHQLVALTGYPDPATARWKPESWGYHLDVPGLVAASACGRPCRLVGHTGLQGQREAQLECCQHSDQRGPDCWVLS